MDGDAPDPQRAERGRRQRHEVGRGGEQRVWREWRDRLATPQVALLALRDDISQPDFQGALARGHVQEQPTRWMVTRSTRSEQRVGRYITPWWNLVGEREIERRVGA